MAAHFEEAITDVTWQLPDRPFALHANETHVWRLFLGETYKPGLVDLLSADELVRASQFHFPKDRENFIAARSTLRRIIGRYLNVSPAQLRFCCNAYGKPALTAEFGAHALRFNVSHSNDIALYAVTLEREVGIDVEYMRPMTTDNSIAEQFFSPHEVTTLRSLPAYLCQTAFFTCWTRKEAYVKAVGKGLSLELDQFDVELRPGKPAALLSVNNDPHEAARWTLQELVPAQGYVGAVAAEGNDWQLKCWQWQDGGE